jgi:hypothetical protein
MAPHAENDPPATEEKTVNGDKSENKPKTKGKKSKAKTEGQNKERIQRLDQLYGACPVFSDCEADNSTGTARKRERITLSLHQRTRLNENSQPRTRMSF